MTKEHLALFAGIARVTLEVRAVDRRVRRFFETNWQTDKRLDDLEEKLEALKFDMKYELAQIRKDYERLSCDLALK